jgi:hypothetical protein
MSRAALSMLAFGVYLLVMGPLLVVVPNALLVPFGFAPSQEPWVRVLGFLVASVGTYYVAAARQELTPLFRWSVRVRAAVFVGFGLLAATGTAPPMLVLFGATDLAAALWTHVALRADAAAGR